MKSTLIILFIALLPTLTQAENVIDKQVEVLPASRPVAVKKVQNSHDLLKSLNTYTERSVSKAKTDSSKQAN